MLDQRRMSWLNVIARLKPDVTPQAAAAALDGVYRQYRTPPGAGRRAAGARPLKAHALGGSNDRTVARFVTLLGGVVALTLLIGCANLANLLLSRAAARQKEIGRPHGDWRRASADRPSAPDREPGAGDRRRWTGSLCRVVGLRLHRAIPAAGRHRDRVSRLGLNRTALMFTAVIASLTGVLFGLAPAWRAARRTSWDR